MAKSGVLRLLEGESYTLIQQAAISPKFSMYCNNAEKASILEESGKMKAPDVPLSGAKELGQRFMSWEKMGVESLSSIHSMISQGGQ